MTAGQPSAFDNLDLVDGTSWGPRGMRVDGSTLQPSVAELSKLLGAADGDGAGRETTLTQTAQDLLVLTFALAHAPIDPDQVVAVRRLREVTFARHVRPGEPVRVIVGIERARQEKGDRSVVETLWRIVDGRCRTLVHLRVDLLCAGGETTPLDLASLLPGAVEAGSLGEEFDCVDNIPV